MKKGKFITFEGPDGSGKTTVSKAVCERLQAEGVSVLYSREPGGSNIAEQIRNVILDPENTAMDARTEALLYAASRRQHLVEKVLPALEAGTHVICDRFVDSSLAYQGYGRKIGIEEVYRINQFAINDCMPDKTLYFDVSVETGLARISGRAYLDRMDQESVSFHKMVWEGYHAVVAAYPERIQVIDAEKPVDEVIEEAYTLIKELING